MMSSRRRVLLCIVCFPSAPIAIPAFFRSSHGYAIWNGDSKCIEISPCVPNCVRVADSFTESTGPVCSSQRANRAASDQDSSSPATKTDLPPAVLPHDRWRSAPNDCLVDCGSASRSRTRRPLADTCRVRTQPRLPCVQRDRTPVRRASTSVLHQSMASTCRLPVLAKGTRERNPRVLNMPRHLEIIAPVAPRLPVRRRRIVEENTQIVKVCA